MKLEIKNIDCINDLYNLTKEESELFQSNIALSIGFSGEVGGDYFYVDVYTVKWLNQNLALPILGRNSIIMKEFNFIDFYNYINDILNDINKLPFCSKELSLKIVAKYFDWEFENYN